MKNIVRDLTFMVGDLHNTGKFPWIACGSKEHLVKFDEIVDAIPLIQYGDIGLHRDAGYLSNVFIPGFMKHAWIFTEEGLDCKIVEAISSGVTHRNFVYPMYSDYSIILRPRGVSENDRKGACVKAKSIVGERYDHEFYFDIEKELQFYRGSDIEGAIIDLNKANKQLDKFKHGFSCTEVVAYSWWHQREKLRLYRTNFAGKDIIKPDSFINNSWEVVWKSESVTKDVAIKLGLSEEGIETIF